MKSSYSCTCHWVTLRSDGPTSHRYMYNSAFEVSCNLVEAWPNVTNIVHFGIFIKEIHTVCIIQSGRYIVAAIPYKVEV